MDVASLGFRTDLALLRLGGATIEDRGDHLVIHSPLNPAFYWGNFLLLSRPPHDGEVDHWLDHFAAEFPDVGHVAIGVDAVTGSTEDLAPFGRRGLDVEAAAVMTATAVHPARSANGDADYRALTSDDDWAQSIELRMRCDADEYEPVGHRVFVTAKTAANRRMVEDGHGGWFGAFLDGRLVAQMGLFTASPGLARFQAVETDPGFRRRGLAGGLVHTVSRYGFDELGATSLVMVADPGYVAIDLYRAVGFRDSETQLQALRKPAQAAGPVCSS